MPVKMDWANEKKTIFIAEYSGIWTWEELFTARDAANRQFDTVTHTVDIIHDWRSSTGFPPNLIGNAKNLIPRMHPRSGINVHVGSGSFFISLWRVFSRAYEPIVKQKKFYFARTMEEAYAIIGQQAKS